MANNETDSNGTEYEYIATQQTFENSYNPDVAPRDKRKLKNLEDSNFQDLDAFVTSECGKFSQELESKFQHQLSPCEPGTIFRFTADKITFKSN